MLIRKLFFIAIMGIGVHLSAQEAFDPFVDYSEFEAASEEEADINFFRNGRFLTVSLPVSYLSFTGPMATIYQPATAVGINISYFFDLRFAFQIGLMNSDHAFRDPEGDVGNLTMNATNLSFKYFFNMQNVTKGLANWNPYAIGGISQSYRRLSRASTVGFFGQDSGTGFHIGGGIEIPILSNKMYLAAESRYTLISFPDENTPLSETNPQTYPGDIFDVSIQLGINF